MTEPTGVEALRAGHRALSAAIEVFDAARAASTEAAIARQRAAHDAERRACDRWSALSEARRAAPGDLRLVARADQAHGAYEAAREASGPRPARPPRSRGRRWRSPRATAHG